MRAPDADGDRITGTLDGAAGPVAGEVGVSTTGGGGGGWEKSSIDRTQKSVILKSGAKSAEKKSF